MFAEFQSELCAAAAAAPFPASPTAGIVWGFSIREILKKLLDKAIELGRTHRDEIEQAARGAVKAVVEFDIPGLPASLEGPIDAATRDLGYQAVKSVLDALFPPD